MAGIRRIYRNPVQGKNYFVIDACFLANKYIPPNRAPNAREKRRIEKCLDWWEEIDTQLNSGKALVYIPDICIAETFKVLARKHYVDKWFLNYAEYSNVRKNLRKDITVSPKTLRSYARKIQYHDISTSRDIIISVDRFYRVFLKAGLDVSLPDLVILATAKYLIDFYDIAKNRLHLVTLDRNLRDGSKKIQELPNAYDPTSIGDDRSRVFISYQKRLFE